MKNKILIDRNWKKQDKKQKETNVLRFIHWFIRKLFLRS